MFLHAFMACLKLGPIKHAFSLFVKGELSAPWRNPVIFYRERLKNGRESFSFLPAKIIFICKEADIFVNQVKSESFYQWHVCCSLIRW